MLESDCNPSCTPASQSIHSYVKILSMQHMESVSVPQWRSRSLAALTAARGHQGLAVGPLPSNCQDEDCDLFAILPRTAAIDAACRAYLQQATNDEDLLWVPEDCALSLEAVQALRTYLPEFPASATQLHTRSFEWDTSCGAVPVILRPRAPLQPAALQAIQSRLAASSSGLPHCFGVSRSEGDGLRTRPTTTLIARFDFSEVAQQHAPTLPRFGPDLLPMLHRYINNSLLQQYTEGLLPLEVCLLYTSDAADE